MFRGEVHQVKHLNPDSIIFSLFTTDEIRKLSVLKISSAVTFDALGYPLPGGFYDRVLGPSATRDELCGTCFKNIFRCPGHFGHIELPLPVLNPLFTKILGTILRISCFHCYMIQIPDHVKHSVAIQMKLLNSGLLMQAMEIEDKIAELIREYSTLENIPEDAVLPIKEYETLAKTILEESNSRIIINKNLEGLKNQFTSDLLREMKARKQCMHCKEGLDKIQVVKNKFVLSVRSMPDKEVTDKKIVVFKPKQLNPEELRKYARKVWEKEKDFLLQLVPVLKSVRIKYPTDVFFFEIIPVPPPNVRPVARMHDRLNEHEQTRMYKTILQDSVTLRTIMQVIKSDGDEGVLPDLAKNVYMVSKGSTPTEKMYLAWDQLQSDVINILDKDPQTAGMEQGLKQIIEKKAGIIRKHMMGKRVNYSARSVITPDPNLNIDEIGIPEAFAKHLTYPVPVTSWNVEELRKMILNGPNVHPGAVMVEFENGTVKRINPLEPTLQESILKRLLTPDDGNKGFKGVKMVHRHLCNGDILLLNRQPTLHRPSIMAHTARILKAEKTLRLHYANCKAYNADFDGDEMNAHFPQNELARSEGYTLANVSNQYLVPKDGTPLSGLIQDHMISGVRMSVRGRFFNKFDYHHLVFQALSHMTAEIILLPPAIIKPMCLWSGKQILSTVIINILPKNNVVINLTATSKIPAKSWVSVPPRNWTAGGTPFKNDNEMSEAEVIIRNGELLVGVLDKTHYGATPYGLVHCIYELYGGSYSTKFLSSLAKLFTIFLQIEGFTLGVHDILVMPGADKKRVKTVKKSRKIGKSVLTTALDLPRDTSLDVIVEKLEESMALNPKTRNIIDRQYKISLDSYTNEINKTCLPAGLLCKFPHNNLQLMVQSGAKGSTVNTMQISCLLGQIELEGKRPPVMISGKSLPSFPIFEFTPRAGGFIDGRFMTGIQPQEFFFHCMAGREGLIDTAVKTSRSGYLQRCLIKHLEGLTVGYDMTVRDSDKSVIQFHYGEDGMDISKAQFLNSKQLRFLSENCKAILNKDMIGNLKSVEDYGAMEEHLKNFRKWKEENGNPLKKARTSPFSAFSKAVGDKVDNEVENPHRRSKKTGRDKKTKYIINLWRKAEDDIKSEFKELSCPSPISSKYQPDCYFGSLNERLMDVMEQFQGFKKKKERKQFENMFKLKAMHSLCAPGEPVGLLAAQSIGEPSTQMTLNTFHFAGRGEMNVTLGIPRLREILMMASKAIKTPSIEIPFLNVPNLETKADNLRKLLTRVVVADVLEKIDVTLQLDVQPIRQYRYTLHFKFLPHALYKADYHAKPRRILKHMTKKFFGQMFTAIRRYAKITSKLVSMEEDKSNRPRKMRDDVLNEEDQEDEKGNSGKSKSGKRDVNDMDSSDEEVEDPEDAKLSSKFQQVHEDQEPDEEEVDIDFSDSEYENDDDGTKKQDEAASITNTVVENYHYAQDYVYDHENHLWCNITFALPLNFRRIDLTAILRDVAAKSVIWETPNIKRAITYKKDDQLMLRTDGINIVEMFKYNELLDLNKLYSNDIHKVATNYGIEAAVKVIVKEVQDVFNVYGIKVDPRHLLLIADYMTFNGSFEPLSRKGMESSASPLQQMSFESSLTFLKQATLRGKQDQLQNPSSCLMLGKPCSTGTGAFTLLQQIPLLGVAK